ncbi:threonine synthase [Candidatus Saccharibacteria bacterium]|nr:threonine synthase [Candidatus Saccharibacteria bacterium]
MAKIHFWHECISCSAKQAADKFYYTCPDCGGLLLVKRNENYLKKLIGTGKKARDHFDQLRYGVERKIYPNDSGVWLWRDFLLPGFPKKQIISLKEGQTDLFETPRWLKKEFGLKDLFIKLEGQAPSESFKDRGMTVAISDVLRLKQQNPKLGIIGVSCASTGDTSASAAVYSAYVRDQLSCLVLVPAQKIADSQLFQVMAHGAKVRAIEHPDGFDACMKIVQQFSAKHPELILVNSKNDMRLVGQEAIGLEILQDLSWQAPDWIAIPVGNGGNLAALLSSLSRAKEFGLINKLPGIIVGQTAAADTLVRWSETGYKSYRPGKFKATVASAMNINDPVSFPRIKYFMDQFNIHFYRVSEPQILKRWAQFTGAGANICPQSAVALDAVVQARTKNIIKAQDTVVSVSTASAVKFAETGVGYHKTASVKDFANPYVKVKGTLEDLEKSL